jgi:hypothetical protein
MWFTSSSLKNTPRKKQIMLYSCFMMILFLAYSSDLKKEGTCFSQTSADLHRTTPRYIPEDRNLEEELFTTSSMLPQQHEELVFIYLENLTFYLLLKAVNFKDTPT